MAPAGSSSGDGSLERPWDLQTALSASSTVRPGARVWLRGGLYRGAFTSTLAGTADAPIVVRAFPGEHVAGDGATANTQNTITIRGAHTHFWGLEVLNSDPQRLMPAHRWHGFQVEGPGTKIINCVIHDTGEGIGAWEGAENSEIYGCVLYNNGIDASDRAHGHAIYANNARGRKVIRANIAGNGFGSGIIAYTTAGMLNGFEVAENLVFNNGASARGSSTDDLADNILIGGLRPARDIYVHHNHSWSRTLGERGVRFGYSAVNEDLRLHDNYVVGDTWFDADWTSLDLRGNEFWGSVTSAALRFPRATTLAVTGNAFLSAGLSYPMHPGIDATTFPSNTFPTATPAETRVVVIPNIYEAGRAHVAVFNWSRQERVSLDLTGVLAGGTRYEIRNAQNYFGEPVARGTFEGIPVNVPLTGLHPAQPIGSPDAIAPSEETGAAFNAFVVIPTPCP